MLDPGDRENVNLNCPFHNDKHSSMSVNLDTGLWKCHTCDASGNFDQFEKKKGKTGTHEDNGAGHSEPDGVAIESDVATDLHYELLNRTEILKQFMELRGLSEETIKQYVIGWDKVSGRFTIPIYDESGALVNIRKYKPDVKRNKMLSWAEGTGKVRLYPIQALGGDDPLIIVEGELDALSGRQRGLNCISATGGASTWKPEWNELLKDRNVVFCYDIDKDGKYGAKKAAASVANHAKGVKVIELPLESPLKDLTDWFMSGRTSDELYDLVREAELFKMRAGASGARELTQDTDYTDVGLEQAAEAKYENHLVRIPVQVVGKFLNPYIVPKTLRITCPREPGVDLPLCESCPMSNTDYNSETVPGHADRTLEISANDSRILNLIDVNDERRKDNIREMLDIPKKCRTWAHEATTNYNVELLSVAPDIDLRNTDQTRSLTREVFAIGETTSEIMPSQSYIVKGLTTRHPKNQKAVHMLHEFDSPEGDMDRFDPFENEWNINQLKIFQTKNPVEKWKEIHDDFETNVTGIYGRHDLLQAIDLVYHSVLEFSFRGSVLRKGWVEGIILGDTRTGKSQSAQRIVDHYRFGEFSSGEHVSGPGLIGGLSKRGDHLAISWGKIPLNDRRLLVLDEAGELDYRIIAQMSGIRSSGIAEIVKIEQQRTSARTRLLWIANPRHGAMGDYPTGASALMELMGKPEDVARFDFAITAANNEVSAGIVNALQKTDEPKFTSDLSHLLVLWAWTRRADHVMWEHKDVEDLVIEFALEMGQIYTNIVPLVQSQDQRNKIARLSVATAVRFFSSKNGDDVLVTADHVKSARDFLENAYRKESMGYWQLSEEVKQDEMNESDENRAREWIQDADNRDLLDLFYNTGNKGVPIWYFKEVAGGNSRNIRSRMQILKLVKNTRDGIVPTSDFMRLIREQRLQKADWRS
jgi:putative DNA primase/helicase